MTLITTVMCFGLLECTIPIIPLLRQSASFVDRFECKDDSVPIIVIDPDASGVLNRVERYRIDLLTRDSEGDECDNTAHHTVIQLRPRVVMLRHHYSGRGEGVMV